MRRRLTDTSVFFFFNDTATTEIYTLSLHDALPISTIASGTPTTSTWESASLRDTRRMPSVGSRVNALNAADIANRDRKSTRLNSSHLVISYAVFCLKKKNRPTP